MRHRPTSTAYCIAVLRSSSYIVVYRILKRVMQSADTNSSNLYVYIIKLLINTVLLVTVGIYFVFYIIFTWSAVLLYWSAVFRQTPKLTTDPQFLKTPNNPCPISVLCVIRAVLYSQSYLPKEMHDSTNLRYRLYVFEALVETAQGPRSFSMHLSAHTKHIGTGGRFRSDGSLV